MNRGIKIIEILLSLIMLSILSMIIVICSPYSEFPFGINRAQLVQNILTNNYASQYLFWSAIIFAIAIIVLILVIIFSPRDRQTFTLKENHGRLSIDKRAIQGYVRSKLDQTDFVNDPKIKVLATNKSVHVKINGQLARTSSLIDNTEILTDEIHDELQNLLGIQKDIKVNVEYKNFDKVRDDAIASRSRVE